jgi:hypothetical protein
MKRHLKLALGAFGILAGCAFATASAFADDHYHGGQGSAPQHSSAAPSRGTGGGSAPHFQGYSGAPHFPSGYPQRQQFYHGPSGPPVSAHAWPTQHTTMQYHGSVGGHGYAPGAWAHGLNGSHSTAVHHSTFYSFRGRHITSLGSHDREIWRGGNWRHSWHNGHYGWWWFTGGGWFFYDQPIYPYPDYISDYDYDDYGDSDYGPGGVWYYCAAPQGYYPYVSMCMVPWQPVPAQ